MYQVLYRKWRPRCFEDVVGQPQVTVTLQNELKTGRISHAYLFTGSRGTGKTTCAKILAKAVNCLSPVNGDPCGTCEICMGIDNGSVLDIVEMDAASNNGVDDIRNLRDEVNFMPVAAKYRVYIVDEVHMLSASAFNALLKTLEEPPAHVIFILATTEVNKLPATILSRCQRFDFRRIPPEEICSRLTYITEQEGGTLEKEAGLLLARLADGGMRDALSLLDQCIGISLNVTEELVRKTVGLPGREPLIALSDAALSGNTEKVMEAVQILHQASKDMMRLCEELTSHFRALLVVKTVKNPELILNLSAEETAEVKMQSAKYSAQLLLHALDLMQSAYEKMYRAGNRRAELEMALIKLCKPELDDSNSALLRRISDLEKGGARRAAGIPVESPVPPKKEEKPLEEPDAPKKEPVEVLPPDSGEIKRLKEWPEILSVMRDYSQSVAMAFNGSNAYIRGEFVLIDAPQELAFELLRKPSQRDKMRDAIRQVTGKIYKLGPYKNQQEADKKEESDPLSQLISDARAAGVEVNEKE